MSEHATFTDEDLTAYLDGEASSSRVLQIEMALANDSTLRVRLDQLSVDKAAITGAFNQLLQRAPNMPIDTLHEIGHRSMHNQPLWRNLAAIAATAVLCACLGWFAASQRPQTTIASMNWQQLAASYHALYVNETLAHVDRPTSSQAHELRRVSDALGKKLDLGALKQADDLEYKRGQILGFEGRPVIQLAYLSKTGIPIALCITPVKSAATVPPTSSSMLGMSSSTWSDGQFEYLLIGGQNANLIERAAAKLATAL